MNGESYRQQAPPPERKRFRDSTGGGHQHHHQQQATGSFKAAKARGAFDHTRDTRDVSRGAEGGASHRYHPRHAQHPQPRGSGVSSGGGYVDGTDQPKESRELFLGNVSSSEEVSERDCQAFLNKAMFDMGLATSDAEPIISCKLKEKFGFLKFHSIEDCSQALNLNGIPYHGSKLRVSRPAKYNGPVTPAVTWQQLLESSGAGSNRQLGAPNRQFNDRHQQAPPPPLPAAAAPLRSFVPMISDDFRVSIAGREGAAGGGGGGYADVVESVDSLCPDPQSKKYRELFVGNTNPDIMSDDNMREFIGTVLQKLGIASSLIANPVHTSRVTGKFAFLEMRTIADAANALNLDGIPFMGSYLKICRPSKFDGDADEMQYFKWRELFQLWRSDELKLMTAGSVSNVLLISNMASREALEDDLVLYTDIIEDTRYICSQWGSVVSVLVPKAPGGGRSEIPEAVAVFVEMASIDSAQMALLALKGRSFDRRIVDVQFYPAHAFRGMKYDHYPPERSLVISASHGVCDLERVLTRAAVGKLRGMGLFAPAAVN